MEELCALKCRSLWRSDEKSTIQKLEIHVIEGCLMCITGIKLGSLVDPYVHFTNKPSLQQQKRCIFLDMSPMTCFPQLVLTF